MRVLARFLRAATDPAHFPPPIFPEVAFLGRSNVGKSSLINSLLGHKVARTSSAPGRTQSINFFEVRWPGQPRPEVMFTDLPGYGYAKVPRDIVQQWPGFIEPYLRERPCLALCLALVDPNIPPQPSDKELQEFLRAMGRPFLVVATKSDRLSGNRLPRALEALKQEFSPSTIVPYSATTGAGREELWKQIRAASANHKNVQSGTLPETGVLPSH
jgi:GTP-binding protein